MSGVHQRKSDGRWYGTAELKPDSYGKRQRKTVYGCTNRSINGVTQFINKIE